MKKNATIINDIFSSELHIDDTLIDAYLAGELTAEETHSFEKHLLECDFCAAAFEGLDGFDGAELDDITARINAKVDDLAAKSAVAEPAKVINFTASAAPKETGNASKRSGGLYRWMGIAASIMLLAVVGYFVYPGTNSSLPDFEYDFITRRGNDDGSGNTDMQKATVLYRQHNYAEAAKLYETIDSQEAHLRAGVAYIKADNPARAVEIFESLNSTWDEEKIDWYLARAYFENGQKDKAVALYESIKDMDGGDYSIQAGEYLELIRKMN